MVESDKDAALLGMVSDNLSIIAISGHNQPFSKKFMVHIWNETLINFEAILFQIWLINYEENGNCDQKMLQIKYFEKK